MCGITNQWVGRGGPVSQSPELTPLDFFLWGSMKSMVYGTPVTSEEDLISRVHGAIILRCDTHIRYIDDMWNGHLDALQRPNRAVPDRGLVLKSNQLAVLDNILRVVHVFCDPLKG